MKLTNFTLFWPVVLCFWSCQSSFSDSTPVSGVSRELAVKRKAEITDLNYRLFFSIPDRREAPIAARAVIGFEYGSSTEPLVLDFREEDSKIKSVYRNGNRVSYRTENGHLILSPKKGYNEIEIDFTAGELSLNRSDEYLYTLLVPDRASTVFPCFDQPNLKARFELTLETPLGWRAMGNGALKDHRTENGRQKYSFAVTQPISTYLFAFTAGRFREEVRKVGARTMTFHYRETDSVKVNRNLDEIFNLHIAALDWLESYTGIPYPFEKFDFAAIPTFQYGGMEHVGAIFYRESGMFLDPNATQNQLLGRASLIAHETAHMWFGDLVTMDWFDDVWLKEVFANFMAAKIVNPSFPEIDHELRFLMSHQPTAYTEDRTAGSHPIQQPLENLRDAGSLYGRIIYQKAPVVMFQLEEILGVEAMQAGLREYLHTYSFANATWDDLVRILDAKSAEDLKSWSGVWVKEGGMPEYRVERSPGKAGEGLRVKVAPVNKSAAGNSWVQKTRIIAGKDLKGWANSAKIGEGVVEVEVPSAFGEPDFILASGSPGSYGYFALDGNSLDFFVKTGANHVEPPLVRGAVWMTLYEEVLRGRIPARQAAELLTNALSQETDPLILQYLLGRLAGIYWKFLNASERQELAIRLEQVLWQELQTSRSIKRKSAFWRTYQEVALSDTAVARLRQIWVGDLQIPGFPLSENDQTDLAAALAIRSVDNAEGVLRQQLGRIRNPDRQRRFEFICPALSPEPAIRDSFFERLQYAENRHYEPWVSAALTYLHHPLRAEYSLKYIRPSLELLEEIQRTGDIFFPKRWISATLGGHQSIEAARVVQEFLREHPGYPHRLKNKILQAADLLFRAEDLIRQDSGK